VRYIVYGAGAIGGTLAGRLFQHGNDTVAIARGPHGEALQRNGLTLADPDVTVTLPLPTVSHPSEVGFTDDDVVILAVKSQDTAGALADLMASAPPNIAVVCAQNGVENERLALRHTANVYGVCVMMPAGHLEPGTVIAYSTPTTGLLDLGRYPAGLDSLAEHITADFESSTFSARPSKTIMRSKYAKLLMNLGNALEAACGPMRAGDAPEPTAVDLYRRARREGQEVLAAAGLDVASDEEDATRRGDLLQIRPVGEGGRGGGSSWQSLVRRTGSIEADHLNGEIVLLGRQHGMPTPVNALLQRVANRLARTATPPGSLSADDLRAQLGGLT